MKFLRNNLKAIIAFILGAILTGGIVYAATSSASEVTYTTNKNAQITNVEQALNDLYLNKKEKFNLNNINLVENKELQLLNSQSNSITYSGIEIGKYLLITERTVAAVDNGITYAIATIGTKVANDTIRNGTPSIQVDNGTIEKIDDKMYIISISTNSSTITVNSGNTGRSTTTGGFIYASLYSID